MCNIKNNVSTAQKTQQNWMLLLHVLTNINTINLLSFLNWLNFMSTTSPVNVRYTSRIMHISVFKYLINNTQKQHTITHTHTQIQTQ